MAGPGGFNGLSIGAELFVIWVTLVLIWLMLVFILVALIRRK